MNINAWLTLFRIPAVFTAMSNVYAGYCIAGGPIFHIRLLVGFIASALFMMAGMGLNDVADQDIDAKERPWRPIPCGMVHPKTAKWVSILFIFTANLLVGWVHLPALIPALLLSYSIYLYNFVNKSNSFGPLNMAVCRLLNLILGLAIGLGFSKFIYFTFLDLGFILVSLGFYIGEVTFLSRREVDGIAREHINHFLLGLAGWFGFWIMFVLAGVHGWAQMAGIIIIVLMLIQIIGPILAVVKKPDGKHVGASVGRLLSALPYVDVLTMLACGVPVLIALAGLIFIPANMVVAKKYYTT